MKSPFPLLAGLATMLAGLSTPTAVGSVSVANDRVQIGGFFSQGWIDSSGNNYPFAAEGGTFDFREMALNASATFGSRLRVGAQVFAQRLGNYGEDRVLLDWAVADYNFRQEFGVRAGRIKLPKGLYGEALDLDAVRPFIFLPMALYNPVVRDFSAAFNGGMAYGSVELGRAGSLDYKAFYGDIPMDGEQGVADFFNTTRLYTQEGATALGLDHAYGGHLVWNTPVRGLKAGLSYTDLRGVFAEGRFALFPAGPAAIGAESFDYQTAFAEYVWGDWTFAAEYQKTDGLFRISNPFSVASVQNSALNWYVSAARRFAGKFEAGAYFSVQKDTTPSPGNSWAANHNHDLALSLRCDLNEHVLLKIEHHWIEGRMNVFHTVRTPNPVLQDDSAFLAVKTTLSF